MHFIWVAVSSLAQISGALPFPFYALRDYLLSLILLIYVIICDIYILSYFIFFFVFRWQRFRSFPPLTCWCPALVTTTVGWLTVFFAVVALFNAQGAKVISRSVVSAVSGAIFAFPAARDSLYTFLILLSSMYF